MAFDKPHLRVEAFLTSSAYARPKGGGGKPRNYGRAYEQHAEQLKQEIATAWANADGLLAERVDPVGTPGSYVSFTTAPEAQAPDLEWSSKGIRLATVERTAEDRVEGALFVPDAAREFLLDKISRYGAPKTGKRQKNEDRFAPVDRFAAARLEALWKDQRALPAEEQSAWWECWCWPDRVGGFVAKAEALDLSIAADRLHFHEREVVFVHGTRKQISRLVSSTDAVGELRSGRDTASFFAGQPRPDQAGWIDAMVPLLVDERSAAAPAVCLLDTGVNRAHPLLEAYLDPADLHAVEAAWGTDDHDGHGTELAGLALHGDLTVPLQSLQPTPVTVALESVKLMPPDEFPDNQPASLGLLTLQAVARPEITRPDRQRVYCLALGQEDVSGPRASSWSAAIDQAASGAIDEPGQRRRRLFVVAGGNIPDTAALGDLEDRDAFEVEDPAQAWNALTVGGVTQKAELLESTYKGWAVAAQVDELSPFTKVSAAWNRSVAPVKPELLAEAGNRGIDPVGEGLVSGIESLSLLTTGRSMLTEPLSTTWATSAAAAQVAGMAARVAATGPELWPESVRALLVHSARWTPPMKTAFAGAAKKGERLKLARRFGYGRPSLDRAAGSAAASLAMVSQSHIRPYRQGDASGAKFNVFHLYQLPWPKQALADIADADVRLRVTLSYFVDPNPSADAPLDPARYRSFGLRFDLRKKGETAAAFAGRMNQNADAPEDDLDLAEDDKARLFGSKSVSAGSLHVEEWTCSAADFIERDTLAIYPVGGWWKTAKDKAVNEQEARYSLVVTLDAGDADVDLYSEIEQQVAVKIAAAVEV